MLLRISKVRVGVVDQERAKRNTAVFFGCDDVDATWQDLVARGVTFVQEPVDLPFGRWALFEDGQGNRFPLTAV